MFREPRDGKTSENIQYNVYQLHANNNVDANHNVGEWGWMGVDRGGGRRVDRQRTETEGGRTEGGWGELEGVVEARAREKIKVDSSSAML